MEPGERVSLFVDDHVRAASSARPRRCALLHRHARRAPRAAPRCRAAGASIVTSNELFNEVWLPLDRRPAHDGRPRRPRGSTRTPACPGSAPPSAATASSPPLQTALGRPGAWRAACCGYLAAHAGDRVPSRQRDAEPGKILHETRQGEMAALGEVPFGRYYGTVDCHAAVRDAGRRVFRAHRRSSPRSVTLWPNLEAALAMDRSRTATATAMASSSTEPDQRRRPRSTRAGRIRTTRSSTPTAAWPRARSRCARSRATSTPPGATRRELAAALGGIGVGRQRFDGQAAALQASASRRPSGARSSAPMRWPSTATSSPAACGPRTPASACSPGIAERRACASAWPHA